MLAWSIEQLRTTLDGAKSRASEPVLSSPTDVDHRLIADAVNLARRFDDEQLERFFAEQWARASGLGFVHKIAVPFMEAVGQAWAAGDLGIRHEQTEREKSHHRDAT